MPYINSQPHLGRIVLYRDKFPMKGYSDFTSFINALDEELFTPFFLLLPKNDPINYRCFDVVFIPQTGLVNPLLPLVFLNKCSLSFSEETREINLESSMSKLWLAIHILLWGGATALMLYFFLIDGHNIFILLACLCLFPPFTIYRRDIRRFRHIRSFASKRK